MIVIDGWPWIISTRPPSGGDSGQKLDLLSVKKERSWSEARIKASHRLNRVAPASKVGSLDHARRNKTIWRKFHPVNGLLYRYAAMVFVPLQNAAADKANAGIFGKALPHRVEVVSRRIAIIICKHQNGRFCHVATRIVSICEPLFRFAYQLNRTGEVGDKVFEDRLSIV